MKKLHKNDLGLFFSMFNLKSNSTETKKYLQSNTLKNNLLLQG